MQVKLGWIPQPALTFFRVGSGWGDSKAVEQFLSHHLENLQMVLGYWRQPSRCNKYIQDSTQQISDPCYLRVLNCWVVPGQSRGLVLSEGDALLCVVIQGPGWYHLQHVVSMVTLGVALLFIWKKKESKKEYVGEIFISKVGRRHTHITASHVTFPSTQPQGHTWLLGNIV